MTTITVQHVVTAAQQLSPTEQLEIIHALTDVLSKRFAVLANQSSTSSAWLGQLAPSIRRSEVVRNLHDFAADFWPADETADDVTTYLAQQRAADRDRVIADDL